MKRWSLIAAAAAVLLASSRAGEIRGAGKSEEASLIQILQSVQAPEEKEAACVRLHRIGTDQAVPALAALLGDARLSHAARHALAAMSSPAAGRALIEALATTSGPERLGIVGSLGVRREAAAVAALAQLLVGDTSGSAGATPSATGGALELGCAAAAALGEIDRREALAALEQAQGAAAAGPLHAAVVDAILRHAERALATGNRSEARRLFGQIYTHETAEHLRLVAFQGVIRSAGDEGLSQLIDALSGTAAGPRQAALRLVPDLPIRGAGAAFASLLPRLSPPLQVALLNGWMQRPDPPTLATVAPLLHSPVVEVRIAAIRALGRVGDGTVVRAITEAAAVAAPEQKAARAALTMMAQRDVSIRLRELLDDSRSELRVEAARALGERGDRQAVAKLLELARGEDASVRLAALRALVVLVEERKIDAMIGLVTKAVDEGRRAEAVRALTLAVERVQPKPGSAALERLRRGFTGAANETRAALLSACGVVAAPEMREVLRAALNDPSAGVRAAAVRAICRSPDAELLPDLIRLAGGAAEEEFRELATKAGVRLATRPGGKPTAAERLEFFRSVAAGGTNVVQKRALLNGLAAGRTSAELEVAESFLTETVVQSEAGAALSKMAPRVAAAAPALAALRRARGVVNPEVRKEIEAALVNIEARAAYVTSWQSASPWRLAGRPVAELLHEPLAPEVSWAEMRSAATRPRLARWEPMNVGTDPKFPMRMRGGDATVAGVVYAYTWLHSPRDQVVRLEVEHDEGIKVWLNGRAVLGSAGGGLGPKSEPDRVAVEMRGGWNLLLIKIAQPAKGWAFAVRVRSQDGAALDEIVADANAEPGS